MASVTREELFNAPCPICGREKFIWGLGIGQFVYLRKEPGFWKSLFLNQQRRHRVRECKHCGNLLLFSSDGK